MGSFCPLTAMELILAPNCSFLYLYSNYMNCFKIIFLEEEKVVAINIIVTKKNTNRVGV